MSHGLRSQVSWIIMSSSHIRKAYSKKKTSFSLTVNGHKQHTFFKFSKNYSVMCNYSLSFSLRWCLHLLLSLRRTYAVNSILSVGGWCISRRQEGSENAGICPWLILCPAACRCKAKLTLVKQCQFGWSSDSPADDVEKLTFTEQGNCSYRTIWVFNLQLYWRMTRLQ